MVELSTGGESNCIYDNLLLQDLQLAHKQLSIQQVSSQATLSSYQLLLDLTKKVISELDSLIADVKTFNCESMNKLFYQLQSNHGGFTLTQLLERGNTIQVGKYAEGLGL